MNCVKILCVDDQSANNIQPLLTELELSSENISFIREFPSELPRQVEFISSLSREHDFFGLLLDLRLDMDFDDEGHQVFYRGPTLAQELRTRMAEGDIKAFPIFLWSVNHKLNKSYKLDVAAHDLFDAVYNKDEHISQSPALVAREMKSLVFGYKTLCNSELVTSSTFGITSEEKQNLDPRFFSYVNERSVTRAARKIIDGLIKPPGLLLDEAMLAARLGVDRNLSNDSWVKLLEILESTKYSGVFSEGWDRWWWHRVELWWSTLNASNGTLRKFTASERVSFLDEKLGLKLTAATPYKDGYSEYLSTVCFATGAPMDTMDGFKISTENDEPWQDPVYVCMDAALERINRHSWKLHPLEMDRYISTKEKLKNG